MSALQPYLEFLFDTSPKEAELIASKFKVEKLNKNDFFLKSDAYCKRLSFITSGYIRVFKEVEGKEVTQWLGGPNYFITELSSLLFDKPARWNIQALTECEIETIYLEDYNKLGDVIPSWEGVQNKFIGKCFGVLEDRVFSFLSMTAEERYEQMWEFNKELFNQVPQQYIASMLGMSPETLSRIRAKDNS